MKSSKRKIQNLSRILKIVVFTAACLLPVFNAGYWITNGYPFLKPMFEWDIVPKFFHVPVKPLAEMDGITKFWGFLTTLIPTAINMLALLFFAKLFDLFQQFEIFSEKSIQCIRRAGFCLILNQAIYPIYCGLISLILTFSNRPGERTITISVGLEQLNLLLIGAMIILVSWIMDEARKLQEEQLATI